MNSIKSIIFFSFFFFSINSNSQVAPVASNVSAATVKNTDATIHLVASDGDFDALTYTIVSGPSNGSLTGTDDNDDTVTYTPTTGFIGTDSFTFKASDDALDSTTKTVTITVIGRYKTIQTQIGSDIDGEAEEDWLGESVSFNEDHTIMAIGASGNDETGSDAGHVRVYQFNGSAWAQLGADINGEAVDDYSGVSVSLSSDGTIVAIGAYENDETGSNAGHVRVYKYIDSAWTQLGDDIDGEAASDWSGVSVSLSSDGTIVAIGAYGNDGTASDAGHVRVLKYIDGSWTQLGADINGEAATDWSGVSVSLSSDGTIVAIGAYGNDGSFSNAGHVRVYKFNGSAWNKLGNDIDGEAASDESGRSVSLSSDGTIVAIGSALNDGTASNAGHVRVLKYIDGSWTQLGADINGEAASDESGHSVSLSSDGTIVAIGAWGNDGTASDAGHVRVYQYNGTAWNKLGADINGEASGDESGYSVSLSSDGTTLAIGAWSNDDTASSAGHVRVYNLVGGQNIAPVASNVSAATVKNTDATIHLVASDGDFDALTYTIVSGPSNGSLTGTDDNDDTVTYTPTTGFVGTDTFTFSANDGALDSATKTVTITVIGGYKTTQTQIGADIYGEAAGDYSGRSVSFNEDHTIMAIGAYYNDGTASNAGHVRVYQFNGSAWAQLGADIDGEAAEDRSGYSISLSSDGTTLAIGAYENANAGHVRVYQYNGTAWNKLGGDIDGEASSDESGGSVSLSADGTIVAIGAQLNDGTASNAGHVRVYKYIDSAWTQLGADIDGEAAGDLSGYSVSLSSDGTIVAIGALFNDGTASRAGHVRVYQYDGVENTWNKLGNDIDGEAATDWSGYSVSLSSDGTIVAIGALFNDGTASNAGHVRVYKFNGTDWNKLGADINGEAADDQSGTSVSLSSDGTIVAIGSALNDGTASNAGHVRVLKYIDGSWTQLGADIDGEAAGDLSGRSVSLSSDGTTLAIGALLNDDSFSDAGHVRVYNLVNANAPVASNVSAATVKNTDATIHLVASDGDFDALTYTIVSGPSNGSLTGTDDNDDTVTYTPTTGFVGTDSFTFKASDEFSDSTVKTVTITVIGGYKTTQIQIGSDIDGEAEEDWLGESVSFNEDHTIMAIGASGNDETGSDAGHVRVYQFNGSAWTQLGADIDGEAAGDYSGKSVSLSSDGTIVAIGAYGNDGTASNAGHVRVLKYIDGSWTQLGDDIDGEAASDWSGTSVSLSSDGTIVAIGANLNDETGDKAGHVRVYKYNGTAWTKLGADIDGEAAEDFSAWSVSLSSDGTIVAIGAYGNDGSFSNAGHVRVYKFNGSAWNKLGNDIDGEAAGDLSGESVSLSSDGTIVAIGSALNDGTASNAGHVRVYQYNGTAWNKLGDDIDGEASGDGSGYFVSLSSDGTIVAIGAWGNDGTASDAGHVRVYQHDGVENTWDKLGNDIDGEASGDQSGYSVSLSADGTTLAVGAWGNDGSGANAGHVRVYNLVNANAPVASNVSAATVKNTDATIHLVASDGDFDALTYTIVSGPSNGSLTGTDDNDDTVTYTPTTGFVGTDSFTFSASDGALDSATKTVTITVIGGYKTTQIQIGSDIDGEAASDNSGTSVSFNEDGTIMAIGALYNIGNGFNVGHVRVHKFNGSAWTQLGDDIDGEASGDGSGYSVSLSSDGTIVAIGAYGNDGTASNAGHVRVLKYIDGSWTQLGDDIDGEAASDWSGTSVSLSSDGTIVAIGAYRNDGSFSNAGQVRVYKFNGTAWNKLGADINGEAASDESGYSVSLSSDGTIVAIGAWGNDGTASDAGHVRVYQYNGTAWNKLGADINGEASGDESGYSVSLSSDGTIVAIGSALNDGTASNAGHVRVYQYNGTAWNKLGDDIDGEASGDGSGYSVSLSSDGTIVAIGAYRNDGTGANAGHVRVYKYNGSAWTKLGDDIDGEAEDDYSGHSVSLSSDGTTLAVGSPFNDGNGANAGHVRVYNLVNANAPVASNVSAATVKNTDATIHLVASDGDFDALTYTIVSGPSNGSLTGTDDNDDTVTYTPTTGFVGTDSFTFKASDEFSDSTVKTVTITVIGGYKTTQTQIGADIYGEAAGDYSGTSVSFNEDHTIMAIGAPYNIDNASDAGHVRVYQFNGSAWAQLGADIDGEAASDESGGSVSLSSDGTTLAIGSAYNSGTASNAGHVRVYKYNGTAWTQLGADIDGEAASDFSGRSVSLSSDGTIVAIGAQYNDGTASNAGHVRVYQYNGTAWTKLGADIDGEAAGDGSGWSVSLSADGTIVAIGAAYNNGTAEDAGHVRVLKYIDGSWTQLGADIDGEAASDWSGTSVSLSSDGTIVAIGAQYNIGNGFNVGHVRVHKFNGSAWTQLGDDIDGEAEGDFSGYSVSLSSDGTIVAIGAVGNNGTAEDAGHVRVYQHDGVENTWDKLGNDIDGEAAGDYSGVSVSLSADGTTLAIGADANDDSFSDAGHVRVYNLVNANAPVASNVSAATVKNTDATIHLVASDGDFDALTYTIVSGPSNGSLTGTDDNDDTVTYTPTTGFVGTDSFTFKASDEFSDSTVKTVTITVIGGYKTTQIQIGADIDGEAAEDYSGRSVSFNEDHTIMAIGAAYNIDNEIIISDVGHVRVYQFSGSAWAQLGDDIDGEAAGDYSGWSVSLSSDGTTLAIGAPYNDDSGYNAGHVRVYKYNGTAWTQLGADIDGEAKNDYSGESVSLSSDGTIVAIGAYGNDGSADNAGHVRVLKYIDGAWTKLGDDIDGEAAGNYSGISVSLSSDGTTLAIGAAYNNGTAEDAGHVRVLKYIDGSWTQLGDDIDGEARDDYSGESVSLSSDGTIVAIGAYRNDGSFSDAGHVRVYKYNGSAWTKLGDDIDGEASGDYSGISVSLSSDGTIVAIGAYRNDGTGANAGHVRVYKYNGSAWTKLGDDIDGEAEDDYSGHSVSLSSDGTTLAVGSPFNDGNGANAGHVRVYDLVNYAPVAVADTLTVLEDAETTSIDVIANDTDVDGDTLSLTAATTSETGTGTVSINDDGLSVDYTPAADFNGTETITYTVSDGTLTDETGTLTITVTAVDDAPVAVADTLTVLEDAETTSMDVIANDTDVDADTLSLTAATTAGTGTVAVNADGLSVDYTPAADFNGTETITYTVSDGTLTDETGTLTITVTAVDDAPVAVDDTLTVAEDAALSSTDVIANDTDADIGDTLSLTAATTAGTGTVAVNADGLSVDYTPAADFNGTETITYTVSDGTLTDETGTLTITVTAVDDAPVAVADTLTVLEDAETTSMDVIANDTDVDADTLSLTAATTAGTGTVAVNADGLSVDYTPAADFNGTETITYTVSDGTLTDETGTLTITVTAVDDAPVAVDDTLTVAEDAALSSTDVIANDTDADIGDTLSLTAATTAGTGTVAVNADGLSVDYTPAADFNGTETITYTVSDGTLTDETGTLTITVTAVDDAPVAVADTLTVLEDAETTSIDVIANDTDADIGDTLSLTAATTSVTGTGTVSINDDGLSVDYTPATDFNGTETITYTVSDGTLTDETGTLTITVTAVDDAPVAVADTLTVLEDAETTSIDVIANDTDGDADTLSLTAATTAGTGTVAVNADGLSVDYTPAADFNGTETITYTVSDGTLTDETGTLTITVTAVNDIPLASDVSTVTLINTNAVITLDASDVDGDALVYSVVDDPTNGTVSLNEGIATYVPSTDFTGSDSFTYKVNDGTVDSETATVSITVRSVNTAPETSPQSVTTNEDTAVTITLVGSDADGDTLTYSIVDNPTNGVVTLDGSTVIYTPSANYLGEDSFTFKVNDGFVDSETATVSITVVEVNDPPVAVADALTIEEDAALSSTDVIANDTDAEGDTLSLTAATTAGTGTVAVNADGLSVDYTPAADFNGTETITYTVSDGTLTDETGTLTITVTAVNDVPLTSDVSTVTLINTNAVITLDASDVDGDALTYSVVDDPTNGTVSLNEGIATYVPSTDFTGSDSFTYKVNDGTVDSETATVSITVRSVNTAPETSSQSVTTNEDTAVTITLVGSDADGDTLTYSIVDNPTNGVVTLEDSTVIYTPSANYLGEDSFTFKVNDGVVDSEIATVSITVVEVNDPPVASLQSVTTIEDVSLEITLTGTDQEEDALTYTIVDNPTSGTLSLTDNKATYVPNSGFFGSDSFTFKVNDGTTDSEKATVSITVTSNDLDKDGVLNDSDECPNTPEGTPVDFKGCSIFTLPANNNKVEVTSATCIGTTDGSLGFSIEDNSKNYTVTVSNQSASFTVESRITGQNKSASVLNLAKDTYSVCFKVDGQEAYEQCFEVVIGEPKALSAFIDIDNDNRTTSIQLAGSSTYNVEINGERFEVKGDNFSANLSTGLNIIKVSTNLDCQGVIEKEVFISEDIMYYPNPTQKDVNVHVSGEDTRVMVSVFSEKGDLIYSKEQQIQDFSRKTHIDLSLQITGTYIVVMEGKTVRKTFKIVKR